MTWPPIDNAYVRWERGPCNWLDICLGTVGWGFGDNPAGRRQSYLDLIAPFDSPSAQKAYGKLSGCALSVLGMLRCWGLDDPELWQPYRIGRAVADVVTIARRHGAWEHGSVEPGLGDIVLVESPEHVLVHLEAKDGIATSCDGGQVDQAGQCIKICKRPVSEHGSSLWIGNRRVRGVARVGLMVPSREQVRPCILRP